MRGFFLLWLFLGFIPTSVLALQPQGPVKAKRPTESFDTVDIEELLQRDADLNPGMILVAPRVSYFQLSAEDRATLARGNLVSSLSPGLRVFWTHHLEGTINPIFYGNLTFASLQPPAGVILHLAKQTIWGFGVGLEFPISSSLPLYVSTLFGLEKDFLTRRVSASELTLDSIYLPRLSLGLGYTIAIDKTHRWGIVVHVSGSFYFPTSPKDYKIRMGWDAAAKVQLANQLSKEWEVRFGPYFSLQRLNASITNQSRTDLGAEAVLAWQY